MMFCRKCNGRNIKSRKNYSYGKKSKPTITLVCKDCGSGDIEVKSNNWRNKYRRH
ncbi:hypothetical protein GF386_06495 [Candidatus Pacearchaeota archaeon]|nr:hypothetical protein [Candidatus Pacearchaeota archaeon]MBD3283741.1 hypothetical protein [Candidatus Pacearchaeota archaeon]